MSKRRNNRALAQQFQDPLPTVPNKPLQLDHYRKQPRKVHLVPRTRTQESYLELLGNPDKLIVFATGPAGTGKTMINRKSTRLNSSHTDISRMPSSA